MAKETLITISIEEYQNLLESQAFLDALQANGVDNWDGYGDALITHKSTTKAGIRR